MAKYEDRFHELSKHSTIILTIEYERVLFFVKGLRLLCHLATQSLISIGISFIDIADYAHNIEDLHHAAHGGSNKKPCY